MTTKIIKRGFVPLALAACFGAAVAAPGGQQVVAGQATFSQQGSVFSITNTPGAIINWQSFSINAGETARFIQQGADSAVLNRIVGQDPSRILGALQSNGKVFLINPNGIVFGRDARVDVNGLVASTLNLSNADFLAGKKNFQAGAVAGDIRNEGAITTPSGGQVFLIAPNVGNAGVITSPQGAVVLAAGHSVQLVDSRDPDLHVVVSAPNDQAINLGQLVARGGKIGIYGALVNQRGVVNADSALVGENGKIVLKASRETVLEQGSVTSATGAGTGGEIHLLGDRVALTGNAAVDASGAAGGGTVLAGGDWQGRNAALPNASQAWFGKDASIRADATVDGDGGKVVLWSNWSTGAFGSISAQGGARGGNGGKVETSGHSLDVAGLKVNAAGKGKAGSWLLDPYDIEVVTAGADANLADVANAASGAATGVTKIAPAVLVQAGTDITLQAQNDLTITDAISTTKSVTASAGHGIIVNGSVSTSGGNLNFSTDNGAISINAPLHASGSVTAIVHGDPGLLLDVNAAISAGSSVLLKGDGLRIAPVTDGVGSGAAITAGSVTLAPHSAGTTISLGSYDETKFSLDQGMLSQVSASELIIGQPGQTAPLQVNGAIDLSGQQLGKLTLNAGSGELALNAPLTMGTGTLSLVSSGAINQSAAGGFNVDKLSGSGGNVVLAGNNRIGTSAALGASGAMTVPGTVATDSGSISLTGKDLTVGGQVTSTSGNINLTAASGSKFTTLSGANVASASGDITVVAGSTSIATGTINGAAGKVHLPQVAPPPPPPPPTLEQCIASPGIAGCASVLGAAKQACAADWNAPHCGDVMPNVNACKNNPSTNGCATVLARDAVLQCVANPSGPDCGSVLPAYDSCQAKPGTLGCDTVVQQRRQLDACVANPSASGCDATLPNYDQCAAKPGTYGCGPALDQHNRVAACIANPAAPNCAAVLPALDACHANANVFGCAPVLAREKFVACVTDPAAASCDAILPALPMCKTTPSLEGCGAVLKKTFNFCLGNANDARCTGILPTISQCVANKAQDGCQVVLPTLAQCIGSPSLQGCSVILPKLEQCAANPSLQGCTAVLPKPDFCGTHPTDPTCQVFNPAPGNGGASQGRQLTEVVQTTVNLVNTGTVGQKPVGTPAGSTNTGSNQDKPADKQSGPAQSENSGAKNDKPATKTYCN